MYKALLFFLFLAGTFGIVSGQFAEPITTMDGVKQSSIDLNGTWLFNQVFQENHAVLEKTDASWKEIKVPGEWRMQGYEVDPGTHATYFREFEVPADWKNNTVYLQCDAVFSDVKIWINGKNAGTHTGPLVAFEKEVSALLNYNGTNRITMAIVSETLADTLMSGTQYAAHQLGGILRKINLFVVPKVHLADLTIQTDLDQSFKDATLKISGSLRNDGKAETTKIQVTLYDPQGNKVPVNGDQFIISADSRSQTINQSFSVINPLKWNAEHPHLYHLELTVESARGTAKIRKQIGFRELEVVGNQLFVNGRPVKLKGVNRHEVHPLMGRSLTPELWKEDAKLYKKANLNYIRTSHYPAAKEFIEWCDSLGLYVELENPISWIGHHANAHWVNNDPHNPDYYPYLENISDANISFFKNHPSIIIWSMANESAWGPNWAKLAKFFELKDPTRPATFHDQAYGTFNNFGSTAMPIANIHYPGTAGPTVAEDFPRPLLFGEYAHLNTYNRTEIVTDPGVRDAWGRGFKKMWEGMYKSRGCLGGAIWSGIDDVFYLSEGRAVGYGEWGPIDGWRRHKPEYFHIKKSYSPVKIHNRQILNPDPGNGIVLQVENRFDFTNLNECKITWELENETGIINLDLPPRQFGALRIYPETKNLDGKILMLTVTSPQGIEVEKCAIEIGKVKRNNFPFNPVQSDNFRVVEINEKLLEISGSGFSWMFNLETGKLDGAIVEGKRVLEEGAELMLLSLTSGQVLTEHSLDIPFHNSTCTGWQAENVSWSEKKDTVKVTVTGYYSEAEGEVIYLFTNQGALEVSYNVKSKIEINPRQFGLVFSVPRDIQNLRWYRKGLWSYYPENHIGRAFGEAIPFDKNAFFMDSFEKEPASDWRFDANKLGTNDFRATRENIFWASLTEENGAGVVIVSDGSHAFRSFVDGEKINFLVADYSTGGGDPFFSSYYKDERISIKKGDAIKGAVKLQLINK